MGSSQEVYENRIINKTFDPLLTPLIFVFSILCLAGSIFFYCYTKNRLKPKPEASESKQEYKPPVKSEQSIATKYSDDHLVVTSNMQERLKMFDKNKK